MLSNDDIQAQVLAVFRAEQAEHRQTIVDLLLDLERTPEQSPQPEQIDRLFRAAHSLKGGARAAGVSTVEQLAHQIENVFAALRQQRLTLTPDICDVIYHALDLIGVLMDQAVPGTVADAAAFTALLEQLMAISRVDAPPPSVAKPAALPPSQPVAVPSAPAPSETSVRVEVSLLDHLLNEVGELLTSTLRARQLARDVQLLLPQFERWRRTWRRVVPVIQRVQRRDTGTFNRDDVQALATALVFANEVIDTLGAAVNRLTDHAREDYDRLSAVSTRLQSHVQQTRMAPLSGIIGPLRLHVRDLARSAGKSIEFVVDDGGAEADRQVLDQVREICLHLLRNAVDHGIEPPEVRQAAGKSPTGTITFSASVAGDRLLLSLRDDGQGIDLEQVRQLALETGLITREQADVDRSTLLDLIFLPGFSTKRNVSTLSGRGVGLDVVRTTVERMGGQIRVDTVVGQGTTFLLSLPLTLQRSHGLLVKIAGHTFALPLDSLQRIVAANRDRVRMLEGRTVLLVENRPLPLIPLDQLLGLSANGTVALDTTQPALVLGVNERQIACLVDEVSEELELVVQRLPAPLRRVQFVSGAAILVDGSVAPILDPVDLVRTALTMRHTLHISDQTPTPQTTPAILVVDDSITTRTLEKNILEAAGYRVILATNGQEALDQLHTLQANGGCQLVLSDVDMPKLNGFELTERIRSDPQLRHLPVVLVTSLDSPADRERGLAAGADAYIVKRAFDQQALLATIARLL